MTPNKSLTQNSFKCRHVLLEKRFIALEKNRSYIHRAIIPQDRRLSSPVKDAVLYIACNPKLLIEDVPPIYTNQGSLLIQKKPISCIKVNGVAMHLPSILKKNLMLRNNNHLVTPRLLASIIYSDPFGVSII